ncbi:hypothetical protein FIBSPDRAFT_179802 [Athelia psychrophila]|uniref:Uncharacterized protein n=1 Tax=Athelia psychrophila TaxID=1759441 RepID=A0A166ST29_9AGAM|nr:hypothetical protein FIBSPDRAFT_179802 [Fibularhizoctonia sp. CBS 109695]
MRRNISAQYRHHIAFLKFLLCGRIATGYAMGKYPTPPVVWGAPEVCVFCMVVSSRLGFGAFFLTTKSISISGVLRQVITLARREVPCPLYSKCLSTNLRSTTVSRQQELWGSETVLMASCPNRNISESESHDAFGKYIICCVPGQASSGL